MTVSKNHTSIKEKETIALDRIEQAVQEYNPVKVVALFSGGHDSSCVAEIATHSPHLDEIAHINTSIGIPETTDHVRKIAKDRKWPFVEYSHENGNHPGPTYDELVLTYGFPGPGFHTVAYNRLKERVISKIVRDAKSHRNDRVLFLTGVRSAESTRRMGYVEPLQREGAKVWCAIIHDWDNTDKFDYMAYRDIPRNPTYDKMHYSGECLCGAFARPGEIEELRFWYPEVADRIHKLEHRVKTETTKPSEWGIRAPEIRDQASLPMCTKCDNWKAP